MSDAEIDYINRKELLPDSTLFMDGAMGTLLRPYCYKEGMPRVWLNREKPDPVIKAHLEYAKAGSEVICTNSFGANRLNLAKFGLESWTVSLNHQSVALARTAKSVRKSIQVWGSVGPVTEPCSAFEMLDTYKEQCDALEEGGVQGFFFETMTHMDQARQALKAVKNSRLPVMISMAVDNVGSLLDDETPAAVALKELKSEGVHAVGINCTDNFKMLHELLPRIHDTVRSTIVIRPSAGFPIIEGDKHRYPLTPVKWANQALKLRKHGVQIIGGCCGTTPKHIYTLWLHSVVDAGRTKREIHE